MGQPTAEDRRAAEVVVGKYSPPVCPTCKERMKYGPGAPEAHVPAHWFCAVDKIISNDAPNIATEAEVCLIDRIAQALADRTEACAVLADQQAARHREAVKTGFQTLEYDNRMIAEASEAIAAAIRRMG